jgi:hypothetical protein
MANTKISALPAATADTAAEIPVNEGGTTKKVAMTAAGAALIEDANATAQRTTLGLGTASVQDVAAFATAAQGATADSALQPDGDGSALTGITAAQVSALPAASAAVGAKITSKITAGNYTVGTTSALELKGGVIYVTGAATITIPAVADGDSFTVVTVGAVAVSIDPNASDLIVLDGVALDDGDKITNLSTAGDIAVLTYYDATGWHASTNGWTDGGA